MTSPISTGTAPRVAVAADVTAIPLRRPWRWISAVVLLCVVGLFMQSLLTNKNIEYPAIGRYLFDTHIWPVYG
ncbi:hypothetical protein [Arthrobacter sp. Soil762]|uniref:hypothetical protein n=1 Tax=Arthrobacter sp. Soil762 TaxID=1736401 RepID=UPI000A42E02E|nr:hypothetical protein [Arthrobacter sp. Soil762]